MFIPFIAIILISLFTFSPSFSLGLFGDDWLAFFRHAQHLGPLSSGSWNYLTYFLTPYGPQDILMGLLNEVYQYQSAYYYIISYLLRMVAAFSFYPLVFYLTKNKLAGFFAVLFFSITVTGLDTTNWVFNMPTYATIALLNTCLYFSLKQRETGGLKLLVFSALFYYLAYITTPIRMHGSLIFIFMLEAFWILQERNIKVTKKALLRFAVFAAVFFIIRYTGQSQGPMQEPSERFNLGIKAMLLMLSQGRFDFIFYPVIMFASTFLPNFILPSFQVLSKSKLLWDILIPSFISFLTLSGLILKDMFSFQMKTYKKLIMIAIGVFITATFIQIGNRETLNDSRLIFLLLIGGLIIAFIIFLMTKIRLKGNIATGIFLGLAWSILSFFFAWWWVPNSIFPTTYRYLIVSAMGSSILLASLISLGKDKKHQISLFAIFSLIILIHITSSRIFINESLASHSQKISDKIWSSIPRVPEIGKTKEPFIFYFEGDGTNGGILHDVITFGFPPHMALLYGIREECGCIPAHTEDMKEIVSAVTDGKSLKAYGFPEKAIPIDSVYAFRLQGSDNLVNLTDQLRNKLQELRGN